MTKRQQPNFEIKQKALRLLGILNHGMFWIRETDSNTVKPYWNDAGSSQLNVLEASFLALMKRSVEVTSPSNVCKKLQKISRMITVQLPEFETALYGLMTKHIVYMKREFLSSADVCMNIFLVELEIQNIKELF